MTLLTLLSAASQAETLPAPPDLAGTWHIQLTIVNSAKVPVLGPTEIRTITTLLATVTPDGAGGWRQHHTTCQIDPQSGLKVAQTAIPQPFVDAIGDKNYTPKLTVDGGAWTYTADFGAQHIAYDPARSGGRPPQTDDHPALIDFEGDGRPGATIHLQVPVFGQVEVYITQLAHTRIAGPFVTPDRIAGPIQVVALEQRSIGAKPGIFASNPEVTHQPDKSVFFMQRVAPGTTCETLL
ncbi:MAG: hypothetical protein AAFV53_30345 [Myxococcota bacterium]